MMVRCKSTRCWDVEVSWTPDSTVATRARWRVDSNSSTIFELEGDGVQVAGERGRTVGDEGTMVGREPADKVDGGRGESVEAGGRTLMLSGRPEACNALITADHPLSRLLILSLSSLFSRACTDSVSGPTGLRSAGTNWGRPMPARSR